MLQGIYCIENKITRRKYIGQSYDMRKRLRNHKKNSSCKNLKREINSLGESAFYFYFLEIVENWKDLEKREQFFIDKFLDNLYNRSLKASRPNRGLKFYNSLTKPVQDC